MTRLTGLVDEKTGNIGGQSSSSIEQFIRTLRWDSGLQFSNRVYGDYCQILDAFRDALMRRAGELGLAGSDDTERSIEMLDEKGKQRLTTAPETAHRLLPGTCDETTLKFVQGACDAELAVAGQRPSKTPAWTAMGDRYFPGVSGDAPSVSNRRDFDAQRPYTAPVVGTIVIDSLSPYTREVFGPNGCFGADPSSSDANEVHKKVLAAMALLEETNPEIAAFVDREIATLVIRSEASGSVTGSSSSPQYIGRAVLWNAHRSSVSIAGCAEQLLHEAIHCHAYRIELSAPFVTASDALQEIISPWSGRSLRVYSYVHASFVWFGLANFWLAALERNVLSDREGIQHLIQAVRGFVPDPQETLSAAKINVADSVLAGLGKMRESMTELWRTQPGLAMPAQESGR